jgi:hypothetical protein
MKFPINRTNRVYTPCYNGSDIKNCHVEDNVAFLRTIETNTPANFVAFNKFYGLGKLYDQEFPPDDFRNKYCSVYLSSATYSVIDPKNKKPPVDRMLATIRFDEFYGVSDVFTRESHARFECNIYTTVFYGICLGNAVDSTVVYTKIIPTDQIGIFANLFAGICGGRKTVPCFAVNCIGIYNSGIYINYTDSYDDDKTEPNRFYGICGNHLLDERFYLADGVVRRRQSLRSFARNCKVWYNNRIRITTRRDKAINQVFPEIIRFVGMARGDATNCTASYLNIIDFSDFQSYRSIVDVAMFPTPVNEVHGMATHVSYNCKTEFGGDLEVRCDRSDFAFYGQGSCGSTFCTSDYNKKLSFRSSHSINDPQAPASRISYMSVFCGTTNILGENIIGYMKTVPTHGCVVQYRETLKIECIKYGSAEWIPTGVAINFAAYASNTRIISNDTITVNSVTTMLVAGVSSDLGGRNSFEFTSIDLPANRYPTGMRLTMTPYITGAQDRYAPKILAYPNTLGTNPPYTAIAFGNPIKENNMYKSIDLIT